MKAILRKRQIILKEGYPKLEKRQNYSIAIEGEYVDGKKSNFAKTICFDG